MSLIHQLYFIRTLTSLHAGTGRSDFGAIDLKVQRDHRDLPTIAKTSMKGALREHFTEFIKTDTEKNAEIFGGNHSIANAFTTELNRIKTTHTDNVPEKAIEEVLNYLKSTGEKITRGGTFIFDDAMFLSIPVRGEKEPFYNVTSKSVLKDFKTALIFHQKKEEFKVIIEELETLLSSICKEENYIVLGDQTTIFLENFEFEIKQETRPSGLPVKEKLPTLNQLFDNLVIVNHSWLKQLTDDFHLPVIARNKIKKGQSENLWYEQVVPAETMFYTLFGVQEEGEATTHFTANLHHKLVRIGGNQSVGAGKCYFKQHPTT